MLYFWLISATINLLLIYKCYVGVCYFDDYCNGQTRDENYFYEEGYGVLLLDLFTSLIPIANAVLAFIYIVIIALENNSVSKLFTNPILTRKESSDD